MGQFSTELKKAMAELDIKQSDFPKLTKGKVTQSIIAQILRGMIPRNIETIDKIAAVLDKPPEDFRIYAFLDNAKREAQHYDVPWQVISKKLTSAYSMPFRLPVYDVSDIGECLSDKGYPVKETRLFIDTAKDYGKYAYGWKVADYSLSPRVSPGEIAILTARSKTEGREEFGLVGFNRKKKIHIGRISEDDQYVVVQTTSIPFNVFTVRKKDILFIHYVVGFDVLE